MIQPLGSTVAVLAVGSELLDGRTHERNVQYLGAELHARGIAVVCSMQCGDVLDDIISCLDFLVQKPVCAVFITGGLGPTVDDRTREALALFARVPLERDPVIVEKLKLWFEQRGRTFAASNARQADKPQGAQWIPNNFGTAPGFSLNVTMYEKTTLLMAFPGIPRELRGMFIEEAIPGLENTLRFSLPVERTFKIFGLPESTVNDRIARLELPATVEIIFNVLFPFITVILRTAAENALLLEKVVTSVTAAIGAEYIYTTQPDESFAEAVVTQLIELQKSVSVAESCSGGLLGSLFTSVPGVSAVFQGGVIAYSNAVKQQMLGVTAASLSAHGAVSKEVALEMAHGIRQRTNTDIAVSLTGIAGPEGGVPDKPVGTVFIALVSDSEEYCCEFHFPFDRERFRKIAACSALDLVRRAVTGTLHV